jgi:hypothetical protein
VAHGFREREGRHRAWHRADRSRAAAVARGDGWDWPAWQDGALVLARHELGGDSGFASRAEVSQSQRGGRLKGSPPSATVPAMPPPGPRGRASRRRQSHGERRVQRFAGLAFVGAVLVLTLLLTAFGSVRSQPSTTTVAAPASTLLAPAGPPRPQIVAVRGRLRLQLPVAQSRVTAIGYHGGSLGALPLEPVGKRGNHGFLGRLVDRVLGPERGELVWYQLQGGRGSRTSTLDVGAPAGTDVFAPVDGVITGMSDFVIDRKAYGIRIDIQPSAAPSLVLSLVRLEPDPVLTVGSTVAAGKTRLGTVLDLSQVEDHALAEFTQDAGNHVALSVRPAPTLALP